MKERRRTSAKARADARASASQTCASTVRMVVACRLAVSSGLVNAGSAACEAVRPAARQARSRAGAGEAGADARVRSGGGGGTVATLLVAGALCELDDGLDLRLVQVVCRSLEVGRQRVVVIRDVGVVGG